jgi:RNA polymerase sigma factor (sigma-70 family)
VTWRDDLERLYREDGDRLWRAVFLYARDREVANEAVSEAFAQALRRGDAILSPASWVWTAAFRLAAGELQRKRRDQGVPNLPEDRQAAMADVGEAVSAYDMSDTALDLVKALRRLSEKQRAAVVLHYYGGYRLTEVARMVGSTPGAVAVHLNRARKRLRDLIGAADA